jgi:hypothetical protein
MTGATHSDLSFRCALAAGFAETAPSCHSERSEESRSAQSGSKHERTLGGWWKKDQSEIPRSARNDTPCGSYFKVKVCSV